VKPANMLQNLLLIITNCICTAHTQRREMWSGIQTFLLRIVCIFGCRQRTCDECCCRQLHQPNTTQSLNAHNSFIQ